MATVNKKILEENSALKTKFENVKSLHKEKSDEIEEQIKLKNAED